MKLLLDTCTFLWVILGKEDLSPKASALFSDPNNDVYLSTVSMWEILIKYQLGRLPLPEPPAQFIIEQRKLHCIKSLPLQEDAIQHLPLLPDHHKDPFDRILVCQAIAHGLTLLTPDKSIKRYPVANAW